MGKRSITKFLAAVPITASIVVNTTGYQNNKNIQFETPKTDISYSEVNEKNRTVLSPILAIDIAKNGIMSETKSKLLKSTLKVKDKLPGQKKTKIVLAALNSSKVKKLEAENTISIQSNNDGSVSESGQTTISQEQLAAMEKMVSGYPIAKMLPYIAKRRPETAAFLVAIAKKESNWGKVSPHSKDGDCFNYWGFKDHRFKFTAGHSCFPSAETAIETVGNRIDKLVSSGKSTPAKISVWKCGSACQKDGNVGKWISDVELYFRPIMAATAGEEPISMNLASGGK